MTIHRYHGPEPVRDLDDCQPELDSSYYFLLDSEIN